MRTIGCLLLMLLSVVTVTAQQTPDAETETVAVLVSVITGDDGSNDSLLFELRRANDTVIPFVLDNGVALRQGGMDRYLLNVPGTPCDFVGFALRKPTTGGADDSWEPIDIRVSLNDTRVYHDPNADMFAPVTADSYPINGSWARSAGYRALCDPAALVTMPTPMTASADIIVLSAVEPTATPTLVPTSTPENINCPGALPSRLVVGQRGIVASSAASNIRDAPGLSGSRIGQIPGFDPFDVLDGPVCDEENGIAWWQIQHLDRIGWVAEGLDGTYYLDPVQG